MATQTEIVNLALSFLGAERVLTIDDESDHAGVMKDNYDTARKTVLEERQWSFATKRYVLTPDTDSPEFGNDNQFLIPPDVIRVLSVRDTDAAEGYNDFRWFSEGGYIKCDATKIYVRTISDVENTQIMTPSFVQAFAARLAADGAIPITQSKSLMQTMYKLYGQKLEDAAATDGMQGRFQRITSGKLTRVR